LHLKYALLNLDSGTGFTFCLALNAGRQKKSVPHFK